MRRVTIRIRRRFGKQLTFDPREQITELESLVENKIYQEDELVSELETLRSGKPSECGAWWARRTKRLGWLISPDCAATKAHPQTMSPRPHRLTRSGAQTVKSGVMTARVRGCARQGARQDGADHFLGSQPLAIRSTTAPSRAKCSRRARNVGGSEKLARGA